MLVGGHAESVAQRRVVKQPAEGMGEVGLVVGQQAGLAVDQRLLDPAGAAERDGGGLMHPRLDGALQIPGSYFHASMVFGFVLMIRTLSAKLIRDFRKGRAA